MSPAPRRFAGLLSLALLAVVTTGCGDSNSQRAAPETSPSSSTGTAPLTETTSPTEDPTTTETATAETTEPAPSGISPSANILPKALPSQAALDANISVFNAEIIEATQDEVKTTAGRIEPGTPAIRVVLKLTNTSADPVDAATLSFPTATVDGEDVMGFGDSEDQQRIMFGEIAPGESQEIDLAFPTEAKPETIDVQLTDPAHPDTTFTLTHDVTVK